MVSIYTVAAMLGLALAGTPIFLRTLGGADLRVGELAVAGDTAIGLAVNEAPAAAIKTVSIVVLG